MGDWMKTEVEFTPTVRQLAELFCGLGSDEMAEFFAHCRDLSEAWPSQTGIYYQALSVKDDMPMGSDGAKFLMDLAAPWFVHTLKYVDEHGELERA
jgi:hypothetical protein